MIHKDNFYILTGGPGVGKTSLLNELKSRGHNCVSEVAREIIKDQIASEGDALPWSNSKKYSELMLSYSIRDFKQLIDRDEIYFFDRGIPDTFGYERLMNFNFDQQLADALCTYKYNSCVFILPPWREIYETDSERKQNFEVAVETYHTMKRAYDDAGYKLIEIPCLPVPERADFIEAQIVLTR